MSGIMRISFDASHIIHCQIFVCHIKFCIIYNIIVIIVKREYIFTTSV